MLVVVLLFVFLPVLSPTIVVLLVMVPLVMVLLVTYIYAVLKSLPPDPMNLFLVHFRSSSICILL
jgi:hypothetical protein